MPCTVWSTCRSQQIHSHNESAHVWTGYSVFWRHKHVVIQPHTEEYVHHCLQTACFSWPHVLKGKSIWCITTCITKIQQTKCTLPVWMQKFVKTHCFARCFCCILGALLLPHDTDQLHSGEIGLYTKKTLDPQTAMNQKNAANTAIALQPSVSMRQI